MKNTCSRSIICSFLSVIFLLLSGAASAQNNIDSDSIVQITTILPGSIHPQTVTVLVKNGMAILDGDIVLGPIDELLSAQDRGIVVNVTDTTNYWGNGEIPYDFAAGFTSQYVDLVLAAIDYINASTHLFLRPRLAGELNYIRFAPDTVCTSTIGYRNIGVQTTKLMDPFAVANNNRGCYFAQIVHEVAHSAGVWHEQSRSDRDTYVTIHYENILPKRKLNFNIHSNDGINIGPYDFDSDMHYGPKDFTKNGLATITSNNGQTFGNATEYSVGDIATINWMYPVNVCPANLILSQTIPLVQRPMVMEVGNAITSGARIVSGNNMTYDAGISVTLFPGFIAENGSTFKAVIEGCGGVYHRGSNPEEKEWLAAAEANKTNPSRVMETLHAELNASPNPFSHSTTVEYSLPAAQKVDIEIHNMMGNLIAQPFIQDYQDAGVHNFNFTAEGLPAGVYFLTMHTESQKMTKRLVLTN
jgi:hypothetical protein